MLNFALIGEVPAEKTITKQERNKKAVNLVIPHTPYGGIKIKQLTHKISSLCIIKLTSNYSNISLCNNKDDH